jgi:hypothetical protein
MSDSELAVVAIGQTATVGARIGAAVNLKRVVSEFYCASSDTPPDEFSSDGQCSSHNK